MTAGRVLWNTSSSDSYQNESLIEPSLPNIKGQFNPYSEGTTNPTQPSGAFYVVSNNQKGFGTSNGVDNDNSLIGFNANRSNGIYKDGATVTPPSIRVHMWRRIS